MTSDGDALFRAICEHPWEDTPRLLYADWLEENGQPERAEFIRLQCEAAAVCPNYPTETARRVRATQLRREFGDRWMEELPDRPELEWGVLYVRGFVDTVRVYDMRDVTDTLALIFAVAPLQYVFIDTLKQGQLRDLLAFPLLGRLVRLRLPGTLGREEARLLTEGRLRFPRTEII